MEISKMKCGKLFKFLVLKFPCQLLMMFSLLVIVVSVLGVGLGLILNRTIIAPDFGLIGIIAGLTFFLVGGARLTAMRNK